MNNATRLATVALLLLFGASPSTRPAAVPAGLEQPGPTVPAPPRLPDRLTDAEFWKLRSDVSEPGGYFQITDNYTSNEREVASLFTMLRERSVTGGVYLGVGPEQNFSYIAAIRPGMAFVLDIRRQAAMQHLLFKAVFELAADRADFISLLFAKPRPAGLDGTTPIQQIWNTYTSVATDPAFASKTALRIMEHLTRTHAFTLTADESAEVKAVLDAFVGYGPAISTRGNASGGGGRGNSGGTFAELTGWSVDAAGVPQSFLSTDEHFRIVKALHEKNLIVPITGDFGGPKALRAIGAYLHQQGAVVSAFYLSNVEQYLFQDGKGRAFYDNVATLPLDDKSVFIRPYSLRRGGGAVQSLCPMPGFIRAVVAGRVASNNDALACAQ